MSTPDDVPPARPRPALAVRPCRSQCAWTATPAARDGSLLMACRGCGSQWSPAEPWLPLDLDGSVPEAARRARAAHLARPPAAGGTLRG